MAHPANRTTDFAPAWLKLEQNQQRNPQDTEQYNNTHPAQQRSNSLTGGSSSTQHSYHQKQPPSSSSAYQHYHNTNYYSNSHNPAHHQNHSPASQHQQHNSSSHHHHRSGRPQLNSYHSTYNGRSSTSGPSASSQSQIIHLQRSQSTGSYNDNVTRVPTSNVAPPVGGQPLEEDFPQLRSGTSVTVNPAGSAQPANQSVGSTAQWRIKERTRDDGSNKSSTSGNSSDKLLTSNMTGKVYRAQVKPVKRSNMIPISNGTMTNPVSSGGSITIKTRENGDNGMTIRSNENDERVIAPKEEEEGGDDTILSSSLDKEKRFLEALGWKEDEESDEECVIPEQDPAQLELIMKQAKAAREQLLLKSKQSMKTIPSAVIPNEDDILSSSDNSDGE